MTPENTETLALIKSAIINTSFETGGGTLLFSDVKELVVTLSKDLEKAETLGFAIQQLTGYSAVVKGGPDPLIELVESMGLTAKEYRQIRKDIQWLRGSDIDALDQYFKYRARR